MVPAAGAFGARPQRPRARTEALRNVGPLLDGVLLRQDLTRPADELGRWGEWDSCVRTYDLEIDS